MVAWSPPGSVRDVDSSTSTSLLNLRKNTARHGRPLTIPARHQGLGARHGDIIGLGRRHHVCFILSFSGGYYAVSSVSVSAATRLAYDMYLDTYADLTFVILVLRPFVTQVFSGSKMGPFHETHKNIIL